MLEIMKKHSCAGVSADISFLFIWVNTKEYDHGLYGKSILWFYLKNTKFFSKAAAPFYVPNQQCMKVPISPHLAFFFDYSNHNSGYGMVSHCSFDLHFPNDAEYLFMCLLLDIYVSSLEKHLFKYFAHL